MDETARRDAIVVDLLGHLSSTAVEGILLTGSMAYGRGYSVGPESDIDILLVMPSHAIHEVTSVGPFAGSIINESRKSRFAGRSSDCMWDALQVDGVVLNPGYISLEFFVLWTSLQAQTIRRDRSDLPSGTVVGSNSVMGHTAAGTEVRYQLCISEHNGRYLVQKPVFVDGGILSDALYCSVLVSDTLLDRSGDIARHRGILQDRLRDTCGEAGLMNLVDYGLRRASPTYRRDFLRRTACQQFSSRCG